VSSELITKVLLTGFSMFYAAIWLRSLKRGEIMFIQGRGLKATYDRRIFVKYALYHGVIAGIFCAITVGCWLAL
jgi:hypothetical protein